MISCKRLAVYILPALYAFLQSASAAEQVVGAEALAMGGAAAASPDDNSGITLNPGTLGLYARYDLHAFFRLGPQMGLHWGINAVDSRTASGLALGLSYSGDRYSPPLTPYDLPGWTVPGVEPTNRKRNDDLSLAVAVPLLERKLSIGLQGTLSKFDHDRLGDGITGNLGVGFAARPVDWMVIGLAGRNLLPIEGSAALPLGVLGGLRLMEPSIGAIEANLGWTALPEALEERAPWTIAVGAEKVFSDIMAVRAGFRHDGPMARRDLTFGLGFGAREGARLSWGIAVPLGMGDETFGAMINQVSLTIGIPDPLSVEAPF